MLHTLYPFVTLFLDDFASGPFQFDTQKIEPNTNITNKSNASPNVLFRVVCACVCADASDQKSTQKRDFKINIWITCSSPQPRGSIYFFYIFSTISFHRVVSVGPVCGYVVFFPRKTVIPFFQVQRRIVYVFGISLHSIVEVVYGNMRTNMRVELLNLIFLFSISANASAYGSERPVDTQCKYE